MGTDFKKLSGSFFLNDWAGADCSAKGAVFAQKFGLTSPAK